MGKKEDNSPININTDEIVNLVRLAGAELMKLWPGRKSGRVLAVKRKPDGSAVTEADLKSNQIITNGILKLSPGDFILSEEQVDDTQFYQSQRSWILDPLDCTEAYIRGEDHFSIFLSLRIGTKIKLGVIYYPAKDELYLAEQGQGAYLNGNKINVNTNKTLKSGSVYIEAMSKIQSPCLCKKGEYQVSTQAMAALCRGDLTGVIARQLSGRIFAWDFSPIALIVEESGGVITSEAGAEILFTQNPIPCGYLVASNKVVHSKLLDLIHK